MEVQVLLYVLLIHSRIKHMTTAPHSDIATRQERLAGAELLAFINAETNSTMTKTQLCLGSGYIREGKNDDGSCKPAFTDFYEAILEAKGIDPTRNAFADGAWYDKLSTQDKDLYDIIEERCPEFTKLSGTECQEFMDELSDYGITTASQFEDAFFHTCSIGWDDSHFAEMAEYITTEINCVDVPDYIVVDWQATWDRNLSYDFFTIEFDGEVYFFHNNF